MNGWRKFKLWLHKVGHWEYWPVWIVYLPCFLIYPIYAIRSRSFLFFTAANPGMDNGGAYLVSKKKTAFELAARRGVSVWGIIEVNFHGLYANFGDPRTIICISCILLGILVVGLLTKFSSPKG